MNGPLAAQSPQPEASPLLPLEPNAEGPAYSLWHPWEVAALVCGAVLLIGVAIWLWIRFSRSRSGPQPALPRVSALAALQQLRQRARTEQPYRFSTEVADVLRDFIGRQFGVSAPNQTTDEFLARIGDDPRFDGNDQALLADFLTRCDAIKFAGSAADGETNQRLVESAVAFVQGVRI